MISVTAAAHSLKRAVLARRPIGSHFKAFGSGRVALSQEGLNDLCGSMGENPKVYDCYAFYDEMSVFSRVYHSLVTWIWIMLKYFTKLWMVFVSVLSRLFPFVALFFTCENKRKRDSHRAPSFVERLDEKILLRIFKKLDLKSLVRVKTTCKKWRRVVNEHSDELPKLVTDQIKLFFDEGEIIICPMDEKIVPIRYPMPSVQNLENSLRHISTLSLFIRGLIPIETVPVLKRLTRLNLQVSQIYFLWCEFDPYAENELKEFLTSNMNSLTDLGFEVCTPPSIISDVLIETNLGNLASIRVWNENGCGGGGEYGSTYAITDRTLMRLAE